MNAPPARLHHLGTATLGTFYRKKSVQNILNTSDVPCCKLAKSASRLCQEATGLVGGTTVRPDTSDQGALWQGWRRAGQSSHPSSPCRGSAYQTIRLPAGFPDLTARSLASYDALFDSHKRAPSWDGLFADPH